MGSVKDLTVLQPAGETEAGRGRFTFSDRYSVFDWGEMPDRIDRKGEALCVIGAWFFEKLESEGVPTHYLGLYDEAGEVKRLSDISAPSRSMAVRLFRVLPPSEQNGIYDYSRYAPGGSNYLIPLEVIYRNRLPEGASVFRRLKEGSTTLQELGLSRMPEPGAELDRPLYDVSTKLEITDRYINWQEAQSISGLTGEGLKELLDLMGRINGLITRATGRAGLINEDGKVEFALDEKGRITVVDVLGTPDECRFTYEGLHVSKELARVHYRGTEWHREAEEAKKADRMNWKSRVKTAPSPLPEKLRDLFAAMYMAAANEITERRWFPVSALSEIMDQIRVECDRRG